MKTIFEFIKKNWFYIGLAMGFLRRFFKKRKLKETDMALYDTLKVEVDRLVQVCKEANADKKLTLSEVWAIFQTAIHTLVKLAEEVNGAGNGEEKKEAVLAALDKFYDDVIAPIDLVVVPNLVEPAADRFLKGLFLQLASGSIDSMVAFLTAQGVLKS
jgi:hypothetical protein